MDRLTNLDPDAIVEAKKFLPNPMESYIKCMYVCPGQLTSAQILILLKRLLSRLLKSRNLWVKHETYEKGEVIKVYSSREYIDRQNHKGNYSILEFDVE